MTTLLQQSLQGLGPRFVRYFNLLLAFANGDSVEINDRQRLRLTTKQWQSLIPALSKMTGEVRDLCAALLLIDTAPLISRNFLTSFASRRGGIPMEVLRLAPYYLEYDVRTCFGPAERLALSGDKLYFPILGEVEIDRGQLGMIKLVTEFTVSCGFHLAITGPNSNFRGPKSPIIYFGQAKPNEKLIKLLQISEAEIELAEVWVTPFQAMPRLSYKTLGEVTIFLDRAPKMKQRYLAVKKNLPDLEDIGYMATLIEVHALVGKSLAHGADSKMLAAIGSLILELERGSDYLFVPAQQIFDLGEVQPIFPPSFLGIRDQGDQKKWMAGYPSRKFGRYLKQLFKEAKREQALEA